MGRSALYWEVLERVLADEGLGDAGTLVAGALEGSEALAVALDRPVDVAVDGPAPTRGRAPEVWLRRVCLTGFRGIGPEVGLDLDPAPGLVLIVGRNGSGKSSLAEGLEVLVTGNARRLQGLSKEWLEGWRNLHHGDSPRVEAQLAVEGVGGATLARAWTADAAHIPDGELTVRLGADASSLEALGWDEALDSFRPFLGTGELARSLDKGPSVVYDALKGILGLHELTEATGHLATARKDLKRRADAVKSGASALSEALADVDDPRAEAADAALKAKVWDLDALEALALGGSDRGEEGLAGLRALTGLAVPSEESTLDAARRLEAAVAASEATRGTLADQEHRAAEVLRTALAWHEAAGDGVCPVCRGTSLDGDWRARAEVWRTEHAAAASASAEATRELQLAESALRGLIRPVPDVLAAVEGLDTSLAREAWADLSRAAALRGSELAEHVQRCAPELHLAIEDLRERARAVLQGRQDRWRPVALQLGGWVAQARAVADLPRRLKLLGAAEKWLKATEAELRDQRFEPLAKEACAIWSLLRQGSHVDLAKVSLAGSGNRRRVELNVTVDGADSVALGVMSQGEVNALALSLFLPRMTSAGSPFRFLVVDDPVQAMDPHKVDGLARVLAGVADKRQVIVLTHDARLFEAVRRLRIEARVIEVQRRGESVVELRDALDPVQQHLHDARDVVLNAERLGAVPARVAPGMCRAALEAVLVRVIRRRRLGRGEAFADVAELIASNRKLTSLASLALFDDDNRGAEVLGRLNREGTWAGDVFQALKQGAHSGFQGDLLGLLMDTERLVQRVDRVS